MEIDASVRKYTPIEQILEWILESSINGATHIDWYILKYDDGDGEIEAQAFYEYDESDEEYKKRMELLAKRKKDFERLQLSQERRQYNILKKKFEGGKQ